MGAAHHGHCRTCANRTPAASGHAKVNKMLAGFVSSTLVIMALTPRRMRTDRVRSLSILPYQHPVFQALGLIVASTLHGCLRNCDWSDTVGFTPHMCK